MASRQHPLLQRFYTYLQAIETAVKQQIDGITLLAKQMKLECPDAIPTGCQMVADRSMNGGVDLQIPMLYVIDSIVKNVREPWNSGFSEILPVIFDHAWVVGAPGLHDKLRRLVGLWHQHGYFSAEAMAMVDACMHASQPSARTAREQAVCSPPKDPRAGQAVQNLPDPRLSKPVANGACNDINTNANKTKMTRDPRLTRSRPADRHLEPQAPQQDILTLLANVGDLASLVGAQTNDMGSKPTYRPLTNEFIKDTKNQGAVDRLQVATAAQQSKFLDNKFLKRKIRENQTELSNMWYLDIETWYGTVTGSVEVDNETHCQPSLKPWLDTVDASTQLPVELTSVPADDHQTACAVSGEKFDKYWDDTLQEWRYLDVARVDAVTARRLGVPDGSLVCVSVLDSDDIACIVTAATTNGTLPDDGGPDAKRIKRET